MEKTIICIGREYGSGGHEIGELLAKRTGYAFYDKEKLFEIAKMRGYEKEMQEYLDEQPVDEYGTAQDGARVKANRYKLIPGHSYQKDPTVHLAANSEASWLFVKVEEQLDQELFLI